MVVETFAYRGYDIPMDLLVLTGGGPDTWDVISRGHMDQYAKYSPIDPSHRVLEIGCGVGRDAIQLTELLTERGSYIGVDIIAPSIAWAQANIAARHPNFRFVRLDIRSQIHNPYGTIGTRDVRLPVDDESVDRILLQSVFSHMFEDDIVHYMREFRRVLNPGGLVYATFFIVDKEERELARRTGQSLLLFEHEWAPDCRVIDPALPESAVGYSVRGLDRMLRRGGLGLTQPIHRGFWCGREGTNDGQDVCILGRGDEPLDGAQLETARAGLPDRITRGWRAWRRAHSDPDGGR